MTLCQGQKRDFQCQKIIAGVYSMGAQVFSYHTLMIFYWSRFNSICTKMPQKKILQHLKTNEQEKLQVADHTICSVRNLPALHFFAQFLKEKEQTRSLYQCGSSTCETTTFGSHPLVYFKVSFCKTQPKNTTWKVSFWCFFLTFWKTRVGVFNIFWSLGSAYGVCPTQFVTMEPDIWEKQKAFMLCLFASSQFLALLLSSGNWEITIQTTPHV